MKKSTLQSMTMTQEEDDTSTRTNMNKKVLNGTTTTLNAQVESSARRTTLNSLRTQNQHSSISSDTHEDNSSPQQPADESTEMEDAESNNFAMDLDHNKHIEMEDAESNNFVMDDLDHTEPNELNTNPDHNQHAIANHKNRLGLLTIDTINGPNQLQAPSREMAELELMNLMTHKMPLQCFLAIWKWAVKSEDRVGFLFKEDEYKTPRNRSTSLESPLRHKW